MSKLTKNIIGLFCFSFARMVVASNSSLLTSEDMANASVLSKICADLVSDKNYKQSASFCEKAAINGDEKSQAVMGLMNEYMEIENADFKKAIFWYQKAAEQNNNLAYYQLGGFFLNGRGTERSVSKALSWYYKAAVNNYEDADFMIATILYNESQGSAGIKESLKWYKRAAARGNAKAQNNIGSMYRNGQGVNKDLLAAFVWYNMAAAKGLPDAKYNLGLMYLNGYGTEKNLDLAQKLLNKAAEKGVIDAQKNLAAFYLNKKYQHVNYEKAYFWLALSLKTEDDWNVRNTLDSLAKKLSNSQIQDAKNKVLTFKKSDKT